MSLSEDKIKISSAFIAGINISNTELFGLIKENYEALERVYPLIEFVVSRLTAVTDLALAGNNWDAEIIYRSALEALVKLVFITSAEGEERENRLREFWEDLSEINYIKVSEQAKKSLKIAENYKSESVTMAFKPLVLAEEEEKKLRERWPVSKRKSVERKWSFSEIVLSLSNAPGNKQIQEFIGLAHNYRYASHVTHADETGILIIRERQSRPQEDRELADFAHFIRLLSDSFFFCILMGLQVAYYVKKDMRFFFDLAKSTKETSDVADRYLQKLHGDQSYDKFRTPFGEGKSKV
jgi:hypothetical protein